MFWTSSSLSCHPTHQLNPLVQAGCDLCYISLILSFSSSTSLISPSPDLSYYFLPPLPPAFLFHVQVNCVSFNPFSEYILATGSADRVSLTLIQTSHPEGNSLYGKEFLIWEAILYMGGNSLYGKKFLIWEEIPYMGGNSLYGRKFLIWEQ